MRPDVLVRTPPQLSTANAQLSLTLCVSAAAATLLGRHPLSLPARTSSSACVRAAPRPRLHTRINTTPPAHLCILERRLAHFQLVTHTASRSHRLALPPPLGAHAPTTQERRALSTHFSERGSLLAYLESEWKWLERVGGR
ncbi:hypothetical protein C8F04DRAFT_1171857 [Mycena alexandri]|uniref:Uncharacterized protein n=1 Tax=Mycena alexandri TaxID=1745969 RepID=A0AAD6RVP1_9AGAR|nr:hypothetical protein C8F04DRAFT_1171857 [Mycena alexandri]